MKNGTFAFLMTIALACPISAQDYKEGLLLTLEDMVQPEHTAVLVIDMQNDFIGKEGYVGKLKVDVSAGRSIIPAINKLIHKAREAGATVIYTRVIHSITGDAPPYMARYAARGFDPSKKDLLCQEGKWGSEIDPAIEQPKKNERVIPKYGYDAFQDTNLDAFLKNKQIKTVITTGVNTNLCVQTTAERAFAKGYYLVVPEDCVASTEGDLHKAALKNFKLYFGKVVSSDKILKVWGVK